jgi:hypothetical protein
LTKYPFEILSGIYHNLCAAREDFRAKSNFRRCGMNCLRCPYFVPSCT